MKELHGSAAATVDAAQEDCFALLAALEDYPNWYPEVVRDVEVIERADDGHASRARTALHVARGPLVRDFRLMLVAALDPPNAVTLVREPHDSGDTEEFQVSWRLAPVSPGPHPTGTRIAVTLDANLSVPRLVPLGGIGDAIAEGFVAAAVRAAARHNGRS